MDLPHGVGALRGDEIIQLSHSTSPAPLCSWGTNDGGDTKPRGTTCCHPRAGISQLPECLETPSCATGSCEVPWCQLSSSQLPRTRSGDSQHLLPQADNALRTLHKKSHPQRAPARRNAQLRSHHGMPAPPAGSQPLGVCNNLPKASAPSLQSVGSPTFLNACSCSLRSSVYVTY